LPEQKSTIIAKMEYRNFNKKIIKASRECDNQGIIICFYLHGFVIRSGLLLNL